MKFNFRYEWLDDEKKVMRYIAENNWNWRDYHACIRASLFAMINHPHSVDTLIDLSESTREAMPSGLAAHINTFGKVLTPALSGHAVVLKMPDTDRKKLMQMLNEDGTYSTGQGLVYFADTQAEAMELLAQIRS